MTVRFVCRHGNLVGLAVNGTAALCPKCTAERETPLPVAPATRLMIPTAAERRTKTPRKPHLL